MRKRQYPKVMAVVRWIKEYWWAVGLVLGAGYLAWQVREKKARAASSVALVELDRERGIAGAEAVAHRKEADAAKRDANHAVKAMQTIAKELGDSDHEKLSALVDAWY